jgi:hypothetical protein
MRKFYYSLVIAFAVIALMWTCVNAVFSDMCGNQIVSETFSPNKKNKAVIFVRDCGATTGYSTQVSILDHDHKLKNTEGGNVLIAYDNYYGEHSNHFGGLDVKAVWMDNENVTLIFDHGAEVNIKETELHGIKINHQDVQ